MTDLSRFPITKKWPAEHPDRIQLYSLNTPNGVKVSIMLEETGLPYEPHLVRFDRNDQLSPEFLSLNPNNKIPAIIDPLGPDGRALALFESGAILFYLAEKSGRLMPRDPVARWETVQWLMFQMGGIGPMFGQVGFFTLQPNEARVLVLFGDYRGTVRLSGFHWANPFYARGLQYRAVAGQSQPKGTETAVMRASLPSRSAASAARCSRPTSTTMAASTSSPPTRLRGAMAATTGC